MCQEEFLHWFHLHWPRKLIGMKRIFRNNVIFTGTTIFNLNFSGNFINSSNSENLDSKAIFSRSVYTEGLLVLPKLKQQKYIGLQLQDNDKLNPWTTQKNNGEAKILKDTCA